MKNNYFLPVTAIVIVFLTVYSVWFLLDNKISQNPDVIVYKEYVNERFNFSFTYPDFMNVKEQNDSVTFIFEGPTQQPNTERFDGIRVSFIPGNLSESDTNDFADFVNQEFLRDEQNVENISPIQSINLGGVNGYTYQFMGWGKFTSYYLPTIDKEYLLVSVFAEDSIGLGFNKIVSDMLSSLTVITS